MNENLYRILFPERGERIRVQVVERYHQFRRHVVRFRPLYYGPLLDDVAYITHGRNPTYLIRRNNDGGQQYLLMRYFGTVCIRNDDGRYFVPIPPNQEGDETGGVDILQLNIPLGLNEEVLRNLQDTFMNAIPQQLKFRCNDFVFGLRNLFLCEQRRRGRGQNIEVYAIRDHYHAVRPGHVRVNNIHNDNDEPPSIHPTNENEFRLLSDDEAKIVLLQLVDGIIYMERTLLHDFGRRFFPTNVVLSNGRIKFVIGEMQRDNYDAMVHAIPDRNLRRTVNTFRIGLSSPHNATPSTETITENRFQAPRYRPIPIDLTYPPQYHYGETLHPVDICMINCVLLVFELMTGGVPAYETPERSNIKFDIFIRRRFLSTQPIITWDEVRNLPNYNHVQEFHRAAHRIHNMSDGLKQLFEAVLLYRPGTWSITDVRGWLMHITENDDNNGMLPTSRNRLLFPETIQEMDAFLHEGNIQVPQQQEGGVRLDEQYVPVASTEVEASTADDAAAHHVPGTGVRGVSNQPFFKFL